jgi:hypothetical protein
MSEWKIPVLGGTSAGGLIYALAEFSVQNIDVMMAALGPFAFRVAPNVPYLGAATLQQAYIALAVVSALLALVTLARRVGKRLEDS